MIKMTRAALLAAAAIAGAATFGGMASADAVSPADPVKPKVTMQNEASRVTVVGQGSVASAPDIMRLNAGVEARRPTAGEAFAAARAAAGRLTQALLDAGVQAKDLQTNDLSLGPEFEVHPKVSGYRASQGVVAIVRDVSTADKVIEAAASVGEEVRLNGVSFEISNPEAATKAARDRAFQDALAKATQYAELADRRIGRVVSISEEGGVSPRPFLMGAAAVADKESISVGQEITSVTVRVVFEFAPQD
ncbi:hypothetical protein SAMN05421505_13851 [Sinosporangium album]|uniref:26 kDa periplasmic immunogenic protein n=1 Tax=Sinosporangium album TaxID=504805 RepID=A0A1G8IRE8_9ACTN|nr:SIMPL domain-containing protein [Sinosporangium album]SDI21327.1 hypothetical protein SAMN05421505_13851 [Sinosporangium album]